MTSVDPVPDLTRAVLARADLPAPRRRTWQAWRRWLPTVLAVVAIGQLGLGLTQLFSPLAGHAGHPGHFAGDLVAGAGLDGVFGHVARETAAFNLAIGIGMLWVALHPERALGQLPVLVSLVLALTLITALDLGRDQIGLLRLSTHVPILLAAAIVLAMVRARPAEPRRSRELSGPPERLDAWEEPT